MTGGKLITGRNESTVNRIELNPTDGNAGWKGISLENCTEVRLYNTKLEGISDTASNYALKLSNCYDVTVQACEFSNAGNKKSGEIISNYTEDEEIPITQLYITGSTFPMSNCTYPAINVIANASNTTPMTLTWNSFSSTSDSNTTAVMIDGVTGGIFTNNTFYGFSSPLEAMLSSVDLYSNTIISNNTSIGINCLSMSSLNLSPSERYYMGGYRFTSTSQP